MGGGDQTAQRATSMIKLTDPVHISFEVGPTINGIDSALALTQVAAHAGAQPLKAQLLDPDTLIGQDRPVSWRDAAGSQAVGEVRQKVQSAAVI